MARTGNAGGNDGNANGKSANGGRQAGRSLPFDDQHLVERLEQRLLLAADLSAKLGPALSVLYSNYSAFAAKLGAKVSTTKYTVAASQPNASLLPVTGQTVDVKAVAKAKTAATLAAQIKAAGGKVTGQFGRVVTANVPISALQAVSKAADLNFARPAYRPKLSAGKVDDQAVQALKADVAGKQYSVTGAGVTVGVMSDSYNALGTAAADVTSGDLPAGVNVLKDLTGTTLTDEGRAMAQLVYDTAPGSSLAFYTAFGGEADFANGILQLAKPTAQGGAGAKVIVDDVFYFDEPIFQEGIVAQAANAAVATYGASYFSSAGNQGRGAYQSAFNPTATTVTGIGAGTFHNFNPSGAADVYQPVTLAAGAELQLTWQWDQPYASAGGPGSASDVDVYLVNPTKTGLSASSASNNVGGDPTEILDYTNTTGSSQTFYLVAKLRTGAAPGLMKYIMIGDGTVTNYTTNTGASFGHNQATNAAGVGAAYYQQAPAFGTTPAQPESYTSAGGTPILFSPAGTRLATPDTRQQPRFTSVDGTDTTFFGGDAEGNGLPNFFGTSAAAPHAAGVAALLKQAVPSLTASQIYSTLQSTALDMGAAGYDFDTGFGLIQADKALAAVAGSSVSGKVFRDYDNDATIDAGEPGVGGVTVFADANANGTVDSGTSGALSSADAPKAIPDGLAASGSPSRVASNLSVSGLTGRVTKVTVTLNITHAWASDLTVTLIGPSGIRVPLLSTLGGPNGKGTGYNVTLDDAAAAAIQSAAINPAATLTGTYRPQVLLSALAGESPNGTWQLEARDAYAQDTGTINSWSIRISYADPTTTTDGSGNYAFANLPPSAYYGAYNLRQVAPAGLTQTSPASPYNVTVTQGSTTAGRNFGDFAPLSTVATSIVDDASVQRSMVRKLVVRFGGTIPSGNISAGAFVLAQTSGPASTFTASVFSVTSSAGTTDVELRFSGAGVVGGSLADGHYTLTVDGSKITDSTGAPVDAAGSGTPGSSKSLSFFRFFGDITGNGLVQATDYGPFTRTLGKTSPDAAYKSAFDFNSDNAVDSTDETQFNARFGLAAP